MKLTYHHGEYITSTINQLFHELLTIYNYQFPSSLLQLFIPRIDLNKINLFKVLVLTLLQDPSYINHILKLQTYFYREYLTLYNDNPNLKQSNQLIYQILKKYFSKILEPINTISYKNKRKLIFYVNNWLNSLAKQQFLLPEFTPTNVKNMKKNLLLGIKKCLSDLINNKGYLNIKNNSFTQFQIGKNLATTKGKIIYKNDLIELIQYFPVTTIIYKAPLLFIPPCINKYYILDLSENNSMVKWLINQRVLVYMISWINPDESLANKTFSDYVVAALQAIDFITNNNLPIKAIHLAGYCMGGTILSCILSYLQQKNNHTTPTILSATNFMSLLDFTNFKDLNEESLKNLEKLVSDTGYLDGKLLSMAFNVVHSNELIWPYFFNYYLLNKPLATFDALYWNSDPINLPAAMYNFYLRSICFENKLRIPNGIEINGVPIDLRKVTVPIFAVAGAQDRISNWQTVYDGVQLYQASTNRQFLLSTSSHIIGLIDSPNNNNTSYKVANLNNNNYIPSKADLWLENSIEYYGSWWPYWLNCITSIDNTTMHYQEHYLDVSIPIHASAPGNYILK